MGQISKSSLRTKRNYQKHCADMRRSMGMGLPEQLTTAFDEFSKKTQLLVESFKKFEDPLK
jgi:hypothetical protein